MNKKILSLVLALVMVLGTFTTVFAEEAKTEKVEKVVGKDNKIQYVIDKKFVEGYGDGDYGYDKNIKRSEITKLLVFANGNKELSEKLQGSMQLYSDVNAEYWANGVISVGSTVASKANKLPMLNGYPDGTFKPENDVTYAELAKMLVVLVKEDLTADMAKEANKNWATQWMTWATQLGILDDVDVTNSNAPAKRADAFTMLYNALYKMVEFKRIPTNDKIGVLSSLRNDKLVLNQDAEKQTYTITKDTVFVLTPDTNKTSNTIKVSSINNPDFYLGSLVRIMVNDKNEVSHILELGNPKEMAVRADKNVVTPNKTWEGVAKNTVETGVMGHASLEKLGDVRSYSEGYVTLGLNGNNTKVEKVNFMNGKDKLVKSLSINDKTKVYVANPGNNQMREVKDIYEAINLIGFRNYQAGYAIPNVYAGFDTDGYKSNLYGEKYAPSDRATAKVIVFNLVSKAQKGEILRVVNQANFPGNATLENTDGVRKDMSFIKNIAHFPYNYGDLYDVIELKWAVNNNNYDVIETLIDHSDVDKYPVVKVAEIKDNDTLIVQDRFGKQAPIYVGDADIFNAKEYKDLKVGDFLQYRNEAQNKANEMNNKISVLSILPRNNKDVVDAFNRSTAIQYTLNSVQGNLVLGRVIKSENTASPYTVTIDVTYSKWDKVGTEIIRFVVSKEDADLLKENVDRNVKFLVNDKDFGLNGRYFAFNFEPNDGKGALKAAAQADAVKAYTDAADAYNKEKANGLTEANVEKLQTLLKAVEEAQGNLAQKDMESIPTKYMNGANFKLDVTAEKAALTPVKDAKDAKDARAKVAEQIETAEKILKETVESVDGTDVAKGKNWAVKADRDALNTAITTAKTDLKAKTTKTDIEGVGATLKTAVDTFVGQRKTK